ncbi:MAG: hypothetical protein IPG18_10735 [Saprospiraceae bacterium]|nr:hypothetical protein [Saprospiraceae bacterium]
MKTGFTGGARNFDPESESTDQFGLTENIQQVLLQFWTKYTLVLITTLIAGGVGF